MEGPNKMEINLVETTSEFMAGDVISYLWGRKEVTVPSLNVYRTDDSILEISEIYAFCVAPRSVVMQLETHKKKHGCYVWMTSARPDRNAAASVVYSREQPIRFVMKLTPRAIIHMSHARMCEKAETPTRKFMLLLKSKLIAMDKPGWVEVGRQMMPLCAYRNGLCTEIMSCGNPKNYDDYAFNDGKEDA